jgi:hemerythrin-like domain-containing protein
MTDVLQTAPAAPEAASAPADVRHLLAIHEQMRIDTRRAADLVERAVEADRAGRLRPFARWAAGFGHELHVHHWVEDDHVFPALVVRRPAVARALADLHADHDVVAGILTRWTPAAARLADPAAPFADAQAEMAELATSLRDLLTRHLAAEDDQIVPVIREEFTEAEMQAILQPVLKQLPRRTMPFTVPWNVAAIADPAYRAEFLAAAPLPLRIVHRLTAGAHQRLVAAAFGD